MSTDCSFFIKTGAAQNFPMNAMLLFSLSICYMVCWLLLFLDYWYRLTVAAATGSLVTLVSIMRVWYTPDEHRKQLSYS